MNEPQEWKEAAAKKRDMRTSKSGEAGVRKNGGGHKGKREGGLSLPLEGMPGLWGAGVRKKRRRRRRKGAEGAH